MTDADALNRRLVDELAAAGPGCAAPRPIVAGMLDHLQVELGMRVLEIGTGTGWNAALLAHMVGWQNVTTIEVDDVLAEQARKALAEAGVFPAVVTGDGADGYPPDGPYDRVIATASAQTIPYQWVAQTRPGGLILTPWGNAYDNGALVRLTVDDHDATFAVGLRLPDVTTRFVDADDGSDNFTFWAFAGPSWACVEVTDGATTHRVRQHGPRSLWTETESAFRWWEQTGRPETGRFGLAVTADHQYAYLDTPDNPVS